MVGYTSFNFINYLLFEGRDDHMKNNIFIMLKGAFVGASMLVPGISGGTMAMILGIYDELISSVSLFLQQKRKSFNFLALFCIGGIMGAVIMAKPLLYLTNKFVFPMMYLFMGGVAGAVPMIFNKAHVKKVLFMDIVDIILGIGIILVISKMPISTMAVYGSERAINYILLLVVGVVLAVALVLPGISVSYMLLVFGMYGETIEAVYKLDFGYLLPLGFGVILGIILVTKSLEKALKFYSRHTFLIILGFVIGSMAEVFPGLPQGSEFIISVITFLIGYSAINKLSKLETE